MSKVTFPLKLPTPIKAAAARLAKEDGVSLNQWVSTAVAQKIGVVETAAASFSSGLSVRARVTWERIMRKRADAPVEPENTIPANLAKRLSHWK